MTWLSLLTPLAGGVLIGLSAGLLLLLSGKIAGITGIVDGALTLRPGHWPWRAAFLAGLLAGGGLLALLRPELLPFSLDRSLPAMAGAGLLVGVGARLGNGCTSGHGVCGMGRLSPRSIASVAVFTATGAAVVFLARHVLEGGLR